MRLRLISLFITVSLALTAVACGSQGTAAPAPNAVQATQTATQRNDRRVQTIVAHAYAPTSAQPLRTAIPLTAIPDSNDPHKCGRWAREDVGELNHAISKQWGEIVGCGFLDGQWVITAIPAADYPGAPGVIAVYPCAPTDSQCLDGRTPHPIQKWAFFPPPPGMGTKIVLELSPTTLYLGAKECFDLDTHIYETCPASLLAQLG